MRIFRHKGITLVFLAGAAFSALFFAAARQWETEEITAKFSLDASEAVSEFAGGVSDQHGLLSLKAFFVASDAVDRRQFGEFSAYLLDGHPFIRAIEWIPRVPHSKRGLFEAAARRDGFRGFRFTERTSGGELTGARGRAEYYPVYFVEPYEGNEAALGFDLASEPRRLAALEAARDTGNPSATSRIVLVQERENGYGFLVFMPLYEKDAPTGSAEERRKALRGFVLGVINIGDMFESMFRRRPLDMDMHLYDESAPAGEQLLHFYPSRTRKGPAVSAQEDMDALRTGIYYEESFDVAGRRWLVICTPTPGYLSAQRTWQPWGPLVGGVMISALVALYVGQTKERMLQSRRHSERLLQAKTELESEVEERKKYVRKLSESEEKFRRLAEEIPSMVFISRGNKVVYANKKCEEITGYRKDELYSGGFNLMRLIAPESRRLALTNFKAGMRGEDIPPAEYGFVSRDRKKMVGIYTARPIKYEGENAVLGIVTDITERKETEAALEYRASHDPLTGIPNRAFFIERLSSAFLRSQKSPGYMLGLLYIDIDHFKEINDRLGHLAGDELLALTARRLESCIRPADTVARFGGDEFTVLLENIKGVQEAEEIADRVRQELSSPFSINGFEVKTAASVGVAVSGPAHKFPEDLIHGADIAMYEAKAAGKTRFEIIKKGPH